MTVIRGRARVDRRTKNLVKRLQPHDIAVIDHEGIDKLAAEALVASRARAVINCSSSVSNEYPNSGPMIIVEAGIHLLDAVGADFLDRVPEGALLEIVNDTVYYDGRMAARGRVLTPEIIDSELKATRERLDEVLERFVENTLTYARREVGLLTGNQIEIPEILTRIKGRHALVVVRGDNYREDLRAIHSYIKEVRPVLIGVDGGADALREFGLTPDIVIGDMDSVDDRTLTAAREIIVHAYPNGRAPGLQRVKRLGLKAKVFAAPGTSEDIAMLLAYEKGAELIVAVGTHSNLFDFLEKGRKGMASTFLVRLKVGARLIDARGVSQLYRSPLRPKHVAMIVLAASVPLAAVLVMAPATRELLRLLYIQLRVLLGI
ncbi:putative cytokinetic ring protein SteA [Candidatus Desulforudis audaxviator]|uniref:Thiamin pyrophosphokinase, catalytic region n=1 Tax=Desulforudis audaxviator (strain MP104C) TaxID=477974 RepID=B1I566_DESAP|nr:putative cytokinetic ring protein SteA [Candidatus Desulforudis audaxviator]ACA60116.1 Thiamin pyrophosphokinase, catalytic region [Candidatus Desulforudis audaxviator MP104C]AZK60152.1 Thiamin pyrophosphokinase [Candidatus Desulforudis audaxviator]